MLVSKLYADCLISLGNAAVSPMTQLRSKSAARMLFVAVVFGSLAIVLDSAAAPSKADAFAQAESEPAGETAVPATNEVGSPPATTGEAPAATPSETPATPPAAEAPAAGETPAADDKTPKTANEKDAEAIRRNELLAEIDERYAPPPKASDEPVAAPAKNASLPFTIGVSLGLGFVALLAATFLVLRPL